MREVTMSRREMLSAAFGTGVAFTAVQRGAALPLVTQETIEPFTIDVSDDETAFLQERLRAPRWPIDTPGEPWAYGTAWIICRNSSAIGATSTTGDCMRRN